MNRLQHIAVADCAIYVWWKGQPACDMLGHVYYMGVRDVASLHAEFNNVVSDLPGDSFDEFVHGN